MKHAIIIAIIIFEAMFWLANLTAIRQEFKMAAFLAAGDNGDFLVPADCSLIRGVDGVDFVVGWGSPKTRYQSVRACWLTIAKYKERFAIAVEDDQTLLTRQYNSLGLTLISPDPWTRVLRTLGIGIGFPLVVILALLIFINRRRESPAS
jgi:hypothetical protein